MTALALFTIVLCGAGAAFAVLFFVAMRIGNFGVVDVLWSLAFAPAALVYAALGTGWPVRRIAVAAIAVLWSLRLGLHLARRVLGHLGEEDGRYKALREAWAGALAPRMFLFFQMQAASVAALSLPFLLASRNPARGLAAPEVAGLALWAVSLAGESLADRQLAAFKRDAASRGRVCDRGLWSWSRHPNYFFEWLTWVAFALVAFPAPYGWTALLCPAAMLWLLLKVTGIRYTEDQLLRSKGDAYRRYQERTSAFVPLPPRRTRPAP